MTVIARISSLCIRNECCFRFIPSVASVYPRSFAGLKACIYRSFYHGTLFPQFTGSIQCLAVFAPCMLLVRPDCRADRGTIRRALSFYSSLFSSRSISLLLNSSFHSSFNPTTLHTTYIFPFHELYSIVPSITFLCCYVLFSRFLTSACILNP